MRGSPILSPAMQQERTNLGRLSGMRIFAGWRGVVVSTVALGVVLVGGLLERLVALRTPIAQGNSDTSIVYLMARHVAHGDLHVFFWGQAYGGTLFQLTAGALIWLFGPSIVLAQVTEIAYWFVASLLLGSIVARERGRLEGIVAVGAFWLATPLMVRVSFTDPGFYGDGLAVGLAAIRVAQGFRTRRPTLEAVGLGLCIGVGFWLTPLTVALTAPASALFLLRDRRARSVAAMMSGAVIGGAPWLWANAQTGLASLHAQNGTGGVSLPFRYVHVFTQVLPAVAGYPAGTVTARTIAAIAVVTLVAGVISGLGGRRLAVAALSASGLLVPAVVAVSGVLVVPAAWRYATFVVAAVIGVLACGLKVSRLALVGLAVLPVWTTITLWHQTSAFRPVKHAAFGPDVATLGQYLERHGHREVWADYWISYLLSAATNERVVAAAIGVQRQKEYETTAMSPRRTTVVLFAGKANDLALAGNHMLPPHTRTQVGPYAIWLFSRRVYLPRYVVAVPGPSATRVTVPGAGRASRFTS